MDNSTTLKLLLYMSSKSSVIRRQILNREENHVIDLNWGDIVYIKIQTILL